MCNPNCTTIVIAGVILCIALYLIHKYRMNINEQLNSIDHVVQTYYTPPRNDQVRINQVVDRVIEPFESQQTNSNIIQQLNDTDNAEDYGEIINKLQKKYNSALNNTIDSVYATTTDVVGSMFDLQSQFDLYGVETMAKTYFDIISK